MEDKQNAQTPGQLNPGQSDASGSEVTIKKNESISDQGNEWSDKEDVAGTGQILGEKAEKYLRDSADVEDLPEEEDEHAADITLKEHKDGNETMADDDDGENEDEVIEDPDDYVPGYDLGRNKVQ